MTPPDPSIAGAWLFSAIASIAFAVERFKNSKKEKKTEEESTLLSEAKMLQERGNLLMKLADDNLQLYSKEHEAHNKTREYWHTKASEFQATLSTCQEKLTDFQSRPDYTDIMNFIKQQAETSVKILTGIETILRHIEYRVGPHKTEP